MLSAQGKKPAVIYLQEVRFSTDAAFVFGVATPGLVSFPNGGSNATRNVATRFRDFWRYLFSLASRSDMPMQMRQLSQLLCILAFILASGADCAANELSHLELSHLCRKYLEQLTGVQAGLVRGEERWVRDRSMSYRANDRDLAADYIKAVAESLGLEATS